MNTIPLPFDIKWVLDIRLGKVGLKTKKNKKQPTNQPTNQINKPEQNKTKQTSVRIAFWFAF